MFGEIKPETIYIVKRETLAHVDAENVVAEEFVSEMISAAPKPMMITRISNLERNMDLITDSIATDSLTFISDTISFTPDSIIIEEKTKEKLGFFKRLFKRRSSE